MSLPRSIPILSEPTARLRPAEFLTLCLVVSVLFGGCGYDGGDRADQVLENQRRLANPEAAAYLLKAEDAYRRGAHRRALELTDSARARASDLADIEFLRGHIFTELKQFQDAQESYRSVADQIPAYEGIWFNLGNNEFRQRNFRAALKLYKKEMKHHPSARTLTYIGRSYAQLSRPDSAHRAYMRAIGRDSGYAPAYMRLGQLLEDEGRLEEALEYSQKGLDRKPNDPDYQYIVGSQLYRTGHPERAAAHLREVVESRPYHAGAHYNLGRALLRLGRKQEAKSYLARSDSLQKLESEIENLRSTAQSHSENPQVWLKLAARLQALSRHEQALEAYRVAQSLVPQSLVVQGNIANIHQAMGETRKALNGYRAILDRDSTIVPAWFNMGVIYANNGQDERARRCWRQVLRYDPNHARARSYLKDLVAEE